MNPDDSQKLVMDPDCRLSLGDVPITPLPLKKSYWIQGQSDTGPYTLLTTKPQKIQV